MDALVVDTAIDCPGCIIHGNGHAEGDWEVFAPWNRQLLCNDCLRDVQAFEREEMFLAPSAIMNPEDIESEVSGIDDDSDESGIEYVTIVHHADGTHEVHYHYESTDEVEDLRSDSEDEKSDSGSVTTIAR
jgi:hypothetical protein